MDNVLKVMVKGLEQELKARLDGKKINAMAENYPSPAVNADFLKAADKKIRSANQKAPNNMDDKETEQANILQQQGADISIPLRWLLRWVLRST